MKNYNSNKTCSIRYNNSVNTARKERYESLKDLSAGDPTEHGFETEMEAPWKQCKNPWLVISPQPEARIGHIVVGNSSPPVSPPVVHPSGGFGLTPILIPNLPHPPTNVLSSQVASRNQCDHE